MSARIAALVSGRGSNLHALVEYLASHDGDGSRVALVVSDRPSAPALTLARQLGLRAVVVGDAAPADTLAAALHASAIDLVVLGGYLKLVPAEVVRAYRGRMVNVHPALLPAFGGKGMYGDRVHRAVLASGARVSGATVHFVDEAYDRGAIIAQWPVLVFADDTEASLADRVLRVEHLLLPRAVCAVASGRITLGDDNRVHEVTGGGTPPEAFTLVSRESDSVAHAIDSVLAR